MKNTAIKTARVVKLSTSNNYRLNIDIVPYGTTLYCKKTQSFLYVSAEKLDDYDCTINTTLNTAYIANDSNGNIETSLNITKAVSLMNWEQTDSIQATILSEKEFSFTKASEYEKRNSHSGKMVRGREMKVGEIKMKGRKSEPVFAIKLPFELADNEAVAMSIQTIHSDFIKITYKIVTKEKAEEFPILFSQRLDRRICGSWIL